ncbi:MAG: hypothetical protein LBP59_10965 [Planctomycetaceae bacterium]|jgi:hypothetical protein|nr:hypothetical protein [Planctomycetaceae bacterium]
MKGIIMNNNIANISLFESLQSGQHERVGMSSLSVFNDINSVKQSVSKSNALYRKLVSSEERFEKELRKMRIEYHDAYYEAQDALGAENLRVQELETKKIIESTEADKLYDKLYDIGKNLAQHPNVGSFR